MRICYTLALIISALSIIGASRLPAADIQPEGVAKNWLVLGPFPNISAERRGKDLKERGGFDTDFLQAIGGEEHPHITSATSISTVTAHQVALTTCTLLDFAEYYPKPISA